MTKKYKKTTKKTRRGGLFNIQKSKSEKDNIKDWYLYWRQKDPLYEHYDSKIRYPGYYNLGLMPEEFNRNSLFQSKDIDPIPDCKDAIKTTYNLNLHEPEQIAKFEKCGANLTGENEKYYNHFWKCKFPKFDTTIDWVNYTTHHEDNCQSPTYSGPRNPKIKV